MRSITFVLAIAFCAATALPADKVHSVDTPSVRNPLIEQLLIGILEDLREVMLTGSDDLPVLDPLHVEHLHLDLDDIGIEDAFVTLGDLIVNQLSTYVIDNVSVTLTSIISQRYSVVIEGHIPAIEIDASKYVMSVSVFGLNIFGSGNAKIRIIEPRIKANIVASISILGGISATLSDAEVVFSLGAFKPEIIGMFDDDIANDFINAFLSHLVPDLVEFFEDEITTLLSDLVLELGNSILGSSLAMTKYDESIRKIAEEANNLAMTQDSQHLIAEHNRIQQHLIAEHNRIQQDVLRVPDKRVTSDINVAEIFEKMTPLIQKSIIAARKDVMEQKTEQTSVDNPKIEQVHIGVPKLPQVQV